MMCVLCEYLEINDVCLLFLPFVSSFCFFLVFLPSAGVPLVYELDDDLKPIPQAGAATPLSGRYLGDADKIAAEMAAVAAQASKKA